MEVLRKSGAVKLDREALYEGLKRARQPGRFEVISEDPLVIIDGAHNEAGAQALQEKRSCSWQGSWRTKKSIQ